MGGAFFDSHLVAVAAAKAKAGHIVRVAGLCRDFLDRPFGPMPELLLEADVDAPDAVVEAPSVADTPETGTRVEYPMLSDERRELRSLGTSRSHRMFRSRRRSPVTAPEIARSPE